MGALRGVVWALGGYGVVWGLCWVLMGAIGDVEGDMGAIGWLEGPYRAPGGAVGCCRGRYGLL